MARLLKPGGEYIIVTDNLPYAKVCAKAAFAEGLFTDIGGQAMPSRQDDAQGVNAGVPVGFELPQNSGSGGGGSFFDRLWAGRGKNNRFFIQGRIQ